MAELILISRIFECVVFMALAGFLLMVVTADESIAWRKLMAASFAFLCLGVSVRQAVRIRNADTWTWWGTFALVAAIIATAGFYAAWRDRE